MATIPKPEDVTAYLAQYQLESVIEEAVNDAVLKQVKVGARLLSPTPTVERLPLLRALVAAQNPFQHIADLLLKHADSKGMGNASSDPPASCHCYRHPPTLSFPPQMPPAHTTALTVPTVPGPHFFGLANLRSLALQAVGTSGSQ